LPKKKITPGRKNREKKKGAARILSNIRDRVGEGEGGLLLLGAGDVR